MYLLEYILNYDLYGFSILNLLGRTQTAGVDAIKGQALLLPRDADMGYINRQVTEGNDGKSHGVDIDDCGRKNACSSWFTPQF